MKGDNEDETTGIEIVKRAIEEPLRQIVANAGKEGAVVVQKVKEGKADFGYNARTDEYQEMYAAGVLDPAKVTRVALENAASIAGMIPIFNPVRCLVAALILPTVLCRSNRVRPQPGQETYSVLEVLTRDACKIPKAVETTSSSESIGFSSQIPSPNPSIKSTPRSAAADTWKFSLSSSTYLR